MHKRIPGTLVAGLLLAASLPALVVAQTQPQAPERRPGLSAEARARLLDGRIAMAKTALKLTDAQLPLWAPVEAQIRASYADRQKRREERRARREERREKREARSERAPLADRFDRASERMTRRAERMAKRAEEMKALAAVFKPFYASLNDEQKAVAGVVLRQMRGDRWRGRGHRWATRQRPSEGAPKQ